MFVCGHCHVRIDIATEYLAPRIAAVRWMCQRCIPNRRGLMFINHEDISEYMCAEDRTTTIVNFVETLQSTEGVIVAWGEGVDVTIL